MGLNGETTKKEILTYFALIIFLLLFTKNIEQNETKNKQARKEIKEKKLKYMDCIYVHVLLKKMTENSGYTFISLIFLF